MDLPSYRRIWVFTDHSGDPGYGIDPLSKMAYLTLLKSVSSIGFDPESWCKSSFSLS